MLLMLAVNICARFNQIEFGAALDVCVRSMENVMSPGVVKVDGAEASEVKAKAKAEGGEGNERGELGELVEGGEGGEGGGGVKLVCSLPPPYLNAELYRGQPPRPNPLPPPYQDFLYIAAGNFISCYNNDVQYF